MRRLGVHTSIAGGLHLSLERARGLGCNTVQIFSHNPRTWLIGMIPEDEALRFRELKSAYDIAPVYVHTSYLINLASPSDIVREKSVRLLLRELDIADSLYADYVVLHTGSSSQEREEAGRKRAIEALRRVSKGTGWRAKLLLENTAGERGDISSRMKDLAEIVNNSDASLIGGICLDSCHAFQAGYDLSSKGGIEEMAEEIEKCLGFESVKLIHLNDSKKGFNSRVDRHEHVGSGGIGKEGLKRFINYPAFEDIPLILETPKKSEEDDPRNLRVVKGLLKGRSSSRL